MARLNESPAPAAGPRLSLLPSETAEHAVVCSLDWLKEATTTPEGLEQAFSHITATIHERDQFLEERDARDTQIEELIAKRDQLSSELLQSLR
jgi:hypothetical protein